MNEFFALFKKELRTCFLSPVTYIVMFFFWVLTGANFFWLLWQLIGGSPLSLAMQMMFGGPLLAIALPIVVPLITMRLVAEERKQGTFEALLTTPLQVPYFVLAKYFSALIYYMVLWLPAIAYSLMASKLPGVSGFPDGGALLAGAFGVMLVGSLYIAIGLLMSCMSSNQIVAAISSFAVLFGTALTLTLLAYNSQNSALRIIGQYYSSYKHMMDFSRGIVDSRMVLMYIFNSAWVLFVAIKVVEAKKGS
ncbi:MAG: ABC transporter permease [Pontiellaceae bacterium]|nr:ABC transporter permease [Pontiellaceae bacterium]